MSNPTYSNNSSKLLKEKCIAKANDYANKQNTFYDKENNEMLYGLSSLMRVTGVSDGTCNQVNPLMLRYSGRCGVGAAGGNPCYDDNYNYIENFDCSKNNQNITHYVGMIFLILILILYISMTIVEKRD